MKEFFDLLDKVLEHPDNQACALVILFALMAVYYGLKMKYGRNGNNDQEQI